MKFFDHANMYMNSINLNHRIDYIKFKEVLTQYSYLIGAFIYVGVPKDILKEKRGFFSYQLVTTNHENHA
ncbi:MAG: hypothetical protein ACFFCI_12730 [Promethearchaeota archaeon]